MLLASRSIDVSAEYRNKPLVRARANMCARGPLPPQSSVLLLILRYVIDFDVAGTREDCAKRHVRYACWHRRGSIRTGDGRVCIEAPVDVTYYVSSRDSSPYNKQGNHRSERLARVRIGLGRGRGAITIMMGGHLDL